MKRIAPWIIAAVFVLLAFPLSAMAEEPSQPWIGYIPLPDCKVALLEDGDKLLGEEDTLTFGIPVELPQAINREVSCALYTGEDNGNLLFSTNITPSEVEAGAVRLRFATQDRAFEGEVRLYLDGKLYQEYHLDLAAMQFQIVRDRSGEAEFQS